MADRTLTAVDPGFLGVLAGGHCEVLTILTLVRSFSLDFCLDPNRYYPHNQNFCVIRRRISMGRQIGNSS
ncbi:hypothetical protein CA51_19890 [Rosistilla oblonga]|uniref:Uncharacterized protein n=1 Tax=Rosistilla oblonga TaxID=2527990 RepID=A0A518ISP0_9BACT|nr:hypothetical protein CA51_19890 [Rosistilla oblonga]QDV56108.1 hypothetical protein Mal33_20870 [Rosistilla oblonga]